MASLCRNRPALTYLNFGGSSRCAQRNFKEHLQSSIKRTGLSGDTVNMRSLIDLRRNPNNLLTSQEIKMNVTSEVKRNFNVLANLNIPAYLSAKADCDRHESEQTEFTLTVKVDF